LLWAQFHQLNNQVQATVKQFTDFDGSSSMAALQKVQNATASDMDTVDSAATAARTGQQMIGMKTATINSALAAMSTIDEAANKVIDTNSMMDAMEDYIQKCLAGNIGIPINYYLKPITKSQLAQMWLAKYYPNKYNLAGAGDDSAKANGAAIPAPAAN
jgi:hypothetical protein